MAHSTLPPHRERDFLFAVLTLERYALLAGSLGLFALLAAVMYLTRWVDWQRAPTAAESTAT